MSNTSRTKIDIKKVTTNKNGIITVEGTAYGEGKDAKVDFSGKFNAKDNEWESFSSKTVDPSSIRSTPTHELSDVVKDIAKRVYELVHENEW